MSAHEPQRVGHVSDGIEEYDNPLPMWWLGILWASVLFSVVFVPYLAITGWSQEGQYAAEVAEAEREYAEVRAVASEAASARAAGAAMGAPSAADVEAGKALFATHCVACHGAEARGGIGPDLTDGDWIHGGTRAQITQTVAGGVLEKGMLAWGPVLGEEKVTQVAAFVHALGGGR